MANTEEFTRVDRDGARVWITGALDMIARDGVQALRIERLAREIGISKGSFYWFFHDLKALKNQALIYWRDVLNAPVFEDIRRIDAPLEKRLHQLVDLVLTKRLGRYDGAIRSWALVDPIARQFVENVDRERMIFMEELFLRDAAWDQTAQLRAHLFYRSFIAESYVRCYPPKSSRTDFIKSVTAHLANPCVDRRDTT